MFICHGFLLFNPSYSHDSLTEIVRDTGYYQTSLGRFLQRGWRSVFSSVTATWFIGCITAVLVGFSAVMLADLFHLKKTSSLIFLSGILITNHCMITSVATYMPWLDTYGGALMFSVLGVWLLYKYRFGFLPGSLALIVSMGLYPPYVVCVPAIVIIQLIVSLQQKNVWKKRLLYIVKAVFMLIYAYAMYRIILKLILASTGVAYSSGNNSMANIKLFGFSHLPERIKGAFSLFFSQLVETVSYLRFEYIVYGLIGISFVVIILLFAIKARFGIWESIAMLFLLLVIPVMFNAQYIVCEKTVYHALMVYSIFFAYLLLIPLYDSVAVQTECEICSNDDSGRKETCRGLKRAVSKAYLCVPAVMIIVLFADIRFANSVYTDKYMRERSTLSVMTRIMGAAGANWKTIRLSHLQAQLFIRFWEMQGETSA